MTAGNGAAQPYLAHHALSPVPSLPGSPFLVSSSQASHTASPLLGGSSHHASPGPIPTSNIPLKQADYPNVKFWYRQDWFNHVKDSGNSTDIAAAFVRGKTLISKGINKNAKYIETEDGQPIDGYRLRDIRAHARAVWEGFRAVHRAPLSWGKADAEISRLYRHEMCSKFPEFRLCDNDWKADLLATTDYPSWYNNHVKDFEIKVEATMDSDSAVLPGSKRPLSAGPSTSKGAEPMVKPKKVKVSLVLNGPMGIIA